MNNNFAIGMIKKDLNLVLTCIFIVLSAVSGGSVIFSILKLNGDFRIDNIYAMYAYISKLAVMFLPVVIWGMEFKNGTINQLRLSKRNITSIYVYKFMAYLIDLIVIMLVSFFEVLIYCAITKVNINAVNLFGNMMLAYFVYGFFYFGIGCCFVFALKDMTKSIIGVLILYFCSGMVCNIIAGIGKSVENIVKYIPFSYAEDAFSFACFNLKQVISILIFAILTNEIAVLLLKKRGEI